MRKILLCCGFALAFVTMTQPLSAQQSKPAAPDCEARIQKLADSNAEGEERLTEKYDVIDYCDTQYKNDKTVQRLAKECAKYVEQPVLKQQFVADCELAAFGYANALRELKAQYRK